MDISKGADKQVVTGENGHMKENGCNEVEKQRLLSVPRYEGLIGQIIIVIVFVLVLVLVIVLVFVFIFVFVCVFVFVS